MINLTEMPSTPVEPTDIPFQDFELGSLENWPLGSRNRLDGHEGKREIQVMKRMSTVLEG